MPSTFERLLDGLLLAQSEAVANPTAKNVAYLGRAKATFTEYANRPDLIELTRGYANRIQNGRTTTDIVDHLNSEVRELNAEMGRFPWMRRLGRLGRWTETRLRRFFPVYVGADGVVGEAIDIITCAIDLIVIHNPAMTRDEIIGIAVKKLDKWERRYGGSVAGDRSIA